jgi:hypothetical protein
VLVPVPIPEPNICAGPAPTQKNCVFLNRKSDKTSGTSLHSCKVRTAEAGEIDGVYKQCKTVEVLYVTADGSTVVRRGSQARSCDITCFLYYPCINNEGLSRHILVLPLY